MFCLFHQFYRKQSYQPISDIPFSTNTHAFVDFSNNIISIANGFTDYINEQKRFDVTYSEDVANLLLILGSSGISTVSVGNNVGGIVSAMEMNSMHTSNIASLHSASREINIVDFSLFTE